MSKPAAPTHLNVEHIAYRPAGKKHPEEFMAKVNGRYVPVAPDVAMQILDEARDMADYRLEGLYRHPWRVSLPSDGGRSWWCYQFTQNDFGRFLAEGMPVN